MKLSVPVLPNSPLESKSDRQTNGILSLRKNELTDLVENPDFDSSLVAYDSGYHNSQEYSPEFLRHMNSVLCILKRNLPVSSIAVEVGCGKGGFVELVGNDGYFFISGYDAAYEGVNPSIQKRYLNLNDRLNANVVILRHVLEHIPQPHEFLFMLKAIFTNAIIYIEVPNYNWIVNNEAYYDITYEHVNYFSPRALLSLFGDEIIDSGLLFGDQYQFVIANLSALSINFFDSYSNSIYWRNLDFNSLFPRIVDSIERIENLLVGDAKLYVWGGATKGCMFLVHCANLERLIDKVGFVIDINPNKIGKFLPGSLIMVRHKNDFFKLAKKNDVLLVANPNYRDEIKRDLVNNALNDIFVETL